MRKLILISAFVLASVSAQAGGIREQILAVNDTPATAAPAVVAAAPAPAPAPAATAQAAPTQASQPSAASRPQEFKLKHHQPTGLFASGLEPPPSWRQIALHVCGHCDCP